MHNKQVGEISRHNTFFNPSQLNQQEKHHSLSDQLKSLTTLFSIKLNYLLTGPYIIPGLTAFAIM